MIIGIQKDELLQMLQTVIHAVPSNPVIASLNGVLLQAENDKITITSNNLEMSISVAGPANVQEPGEMVIPAKLLTEAVRRSPGQDITIKQVPERSAINFCSDSVQMEILTLPVEEFPEQPTFSLDHSYTLPQPLAKNMLKQINFAISTEELRPVLTGALWSFQEEEVKLTALDGFRLACRWSKIAAKEPAAAIVPAKAIRELLRLLGDDGMLQVGIGATYATFEFSGVQLTTRLLEGQFPDIQQFLPQTYQTRVIVNSTQLWQAMERAALVCKLGAAGSVKFSIDDDRIAISAQSMEIGRHYEELPIQKTGEDLEIMYNIRSFIDVLRSAEAEEVVLDLHGSYGPCICRPVGQDDYFSLLMPVRLN